MIHKEISLTLPSPSDSPLASPLGSPLGENIYYQSWEPDAAARAVFIVAHGAAEHSGRYERFAKYFVEQGYGVVALDLPGHGRSGGTPGYIDRFENYLESLDLVRRQAAADMGATPQILLGHSMGGLASTLYLLENQDVFLGCVLSGPAIKTDIQPGVFQTKLIQFLAAALPRVGVLQLDAKGVSRDPAEVERYVEDPLNYTGKLSARLVSELFLSMAHVQAEASKITLPLLILHGGDDSMASPDGSRFLAENVGSKDKTLEIYPGLYHEIFNEPEREQVFADVLRWCDELLAKTKAR